MELNYDKLGNGLVPAIAQDYKTGEILMLAFMNKEAFEKTVETKKATYYSRSRNKLWVKGESSGNIQEVKDILIDCDNDAVLLKINQIGDAACHTGFNTCFYRTANSSNELEITGRKIFNPEDVYKK
ncbi:MAG: phosphoribosyl-AMP cyclohydrolase [Deltaproteobacteria bacterium]|nr:phosphoribosyl-AMP cyclohydrolase [Deltaproteobacteria bacterium]